MNGWQWFWTLVGFIIFIVVLIFLRWYQPFADLFNIVITGLSYENSILWVVVIIGIIGFCGYHWRAYRVHIVAQNDVEAMVLSSLRGSTATAILLSGGATLQAVQILLARMLASGFALDAEFGRHIVSVVALILLTGVFSIVFWLLKVIQGARQAA